MHRSVAFPGFLSFSLRSHKTDLRNAMCSAPVLVVWPWPTLPTARQSCGAVLVAVGTQRGTVRWFSTQDWGRYYLRWASVEIAPCRSQTTARNGWEDIWMLVVERVCSIWLHMRTMQTYSYTVSEWDDCYLKCWMRRSRSATQRKHGHGNSSGKLGAGRSRLPQSRTRN